MSDAAGSIWDMLGQEPHRVYRWGGREYPVREPTLEELRQFCEWLASSALAAVEGQTHLTPEALREHRSLWADKKAAGHWAPLSPAYFEAVTLPYSQAKLVSIVLRADGHAECTHDFVLKNLTAEMEAKLREVLASDPKLLAEAAAVFKTLLTGPTPPTSATPSPAASTP